MSVQHKPKNNSVQEVACRKTQPLDIIEDNVLQSEFYSNLF